ncbi:Mss4-like protein [Delphinella strobiligena]|nr:Mss4-like protein [Delphinella strobiligena]
MATKGHCLCGQVEVSVSKPLSEFSTLTCHCQSCKRRSGGIASHAFIIPKEHVSISGTSHKIYSDPNTGSGKPMQRSMCTECGSPVCIIEGHAPDMRCLQYGLFADQELPPPKLELFRKHAVGWMPAVGEDVKDEQ